MYEIKINVLNRLYAYFVILYIMCEFIVISYALLMLVPFLTLYILGWGIYLVTDSMFLLCAMTQAFHQLTFGIFG